MLGLTNALVSSSTSHKQQYSLLLDGAGDYLNLGNQDLIGAGDFSISVWAKHTGQDYANDTWIGKYQDANNNWFFGVKSADPPVVYFYSKVSGGDKTVLQGTTNLDGGEFTHGTWHHYVVSVDRDGNEVIYIDGILEVSASGEATDLDNTGDLQIGTFNAGSGMEGSIDNLAIFNVALDADAVSAIYNDGRPFDLNKDRGNYDNSSALQGYWRMFDGPFDNKVKGVIHDAHNPGFGAELVTGNNATFDGANDWAAYNPSGTTGISTSGGKLTVTLSGAGDGVDSGVVLEMSSSLTAGKTYKVVFDAWLGTASVNGYRVKLGGTGGSGSDYHITMTSTQTTFTYYIRATDTTDLYIFQTDVDSDTGTFFIDNVSVKELNGYPGIAAADSTYSANTPDDQTMSYVMRFDGTNDYLSTQADSTLATRTYSFWMRSTETEANAGTFSHGGTAKGGFHINPHFTGAHEDKPIIYLGGTFYRYFEDTPAQDDGNWHHWAVYMEHDDITNAKVWVDGVALSVAATVSSGSADSWSAGLTIGAEAASGSYFFKGDIDQFAIFDTELPTDAVASLAGQMWDGTDGDDANWAVFGSNTKAEDTGAVKITYVDNASGAYIYLRDSKDLNSDLIVGRRYKITFETKVNTGSINWIVRGGDNEGTTIVNYSAAATTSTSFETTTIYFTAGSETMAFLYPANMGSGEIVYIKSISLIDLDARQNDLTQNIGHYDADWTDNLINYWKMGDGASDEVGDGIVHDQTDSGYGANLITGNNSTFDGANDWVVWVGGSISTSNGVLELTLSGGGNAVDSGARLSGADSLLTVGKTYRVKADIWLGTETTTAGFRVSMAGVEHATTLSTTQTTFVTYHTATNTNDLVIYQTDVDSATGTWYIDNVSIEELNGDPGMTASGATMIKQPV